MAFNGKVLKREDSGLVIFFFKESKNYKIIFNIYL